MNLKETAQILSKIKEYYSTARYDDITAVAKTWYKHFNRIDFQDVANALEIYVETSDNDFPPTIGKLKKIIEGEKDDVLSAYDAFDMLLEAIKGDYFQEWKNLPESIKRVISEPRQIKVLAEMSPEKLYTSYKNQFVREYTDKNRRKTTVEEFKSTEVTEDMIDRDEFKKAEIRVKNGTYLTDRDWEYMNYYGGFKRYKECKGQPIRLKED